MWPTTPTMVRPGLAGEGDAEALADRTFVGIREPGEAFVDDADARRGAGVAVGVEAAGDERDADGAEVVGCRVAPVGAVRCLVGQYAAFEINGTGLGGAAAHREPVDGAGGLDAGKRLHAIDEAMGVGRDLRVGVVFRARDGHQQADRAIGIEAGTDVREADEAAHEQARADQQQDRRGHLRDHQQAAKRARGRGWRKRRANHLSSTSRDPRATPAAPAAGRRAGP